MKQYSVQLMVSALVLTWGSLALAVEPVTCSGKSLDGVTIKAKLVSLQGNSWYLSVRASNGEAESGQVVDVKNFSNGEFDVTAETQDAGKINLYVTDGVSRLHWDTTFLINQYMVTQLTCSSL